MNILQSAWIKNSQISSFSQFWGGEKCSKSFRGRGSPIKNSVISGGWHLLRINPTRWLIDKLLFRTRWRRSLTQPFGMPLQPRDPSQSPCGERCCAWRNRISFTFPQILFLTIWILNKWRQKSKKNSCVSALKY